MQVANTFYRLKMLPHRRNEGEYENAAPASSSVQCSSQLTAVSSQQRVERVKVDRVPSYQPAGRDRSKEDFLHFLLIISYLLLL